MADQIISNLKEAIQDAAKSQSDLKDRYVKLSWMGMGDAMTIPEVVRDVTLYMLDWILEHKYAKGLDGVDLSTVMPRLKNKDWMPIFQELESQLSTYPMNPIYAMDNVEYTNNKYLRRNRFRLFFSIGSAIQENRDVIIPNATSLTDVVELIKEYEQQGKFPVIFHHLLVNDMNNATKDVDALIAFLKDDFSHNELRILRYNSCLDKSMKESDFFVEQIRRLSDEINFIKVQISPGTEVSAACGQFIVKKWEKKGLASKESVES